MAGEDENGMSLSLVVRELAVKAKAVFGIVSFADVLAGVKEEIGRRALANGYEIMGGYHVMQLVRGYHVMFPERVARRRNVVEIACECFALFALVHPDGVCVWGLGGFEEMVTRLGMDAERRPRSESLVGLRDGAEVVVSLRAFMRYEGLVSCDR